MPESRFDHDTEESGEEEEEDEEEEEAGEGDVTPQSVSHSHSATPEPEENYIPDSPPISPVELKKELPKYLPALQVCVWQHTTPGSNTCLFYFKYLRSA